MKLVNAEQMRRIDSDAINVEKIPSLELMENAGRGIASAILGDIIPADDRMRFTIFCGSGNNGGDGFVIGRHLFLAGMQIEFYFIGPFEKLSDDAKANFKRADEIKLPIYEIKSIDDLPDYIESDYIIDAIFGTGFKGAPKGMANELINYINNQPQTVISVDMPSGVNADNGSIEGVAVTADYTYSLALPKYGMYVSPGREKGGQVDIIPIGIPTRVIDKFDLHNFLITSEMVSDILPIRKPEGHKGDFGKLFVLAGSKGMTGAAVLSAKAALRSGCGLAKIGCPHSQQPIIASGIIEATTIALPDVSKKGVLALRGLGQIREEIAEHDAVIIGPGLGRHHETKELVCRLILSLEKPAIVDADGLNNLAGELAIIEDTKADLILTPHPGEFFRLTGEKISDDIFERIEAARKFAIEYQTILILKGSPSIVADKDGKIYVNQTGNNGMATGGSGDVLSGIIGSLLAQQVEPIHAALAGVFIHGLAGDIAAYELGRRSMIASDMIDSLADSFLIIE